MWGKCWCNDKWLKKRRLNSGLETNHYYCFSLFGATVILMFSAKLNIKTGQIGNVAQNRKSKLLSCVVLQNKLWMETTWSRELNCFLDKKPNTGRKFCSHQVTAGLTPNQQGAQDISRWRAEPLHRNGRFQIDRSSVDGWWRWQIPPIMPEMQMSTGIPVLLCWDEFHKSFHPRILSDLIQRDWSRLIFHLYKQPGCSSKSKMSPKWLPYY